MWSDPALALVIWRVSVLSITMPNSNDTISCHVRHAASVARIVFPEAFRGHEEADLGEVVPWCVT